MNAKIRRPTVRRSSVTDLRGAARLATDATAGLTDLVEAMHERIVRLPGFGIGAAAAAGRTHGLTGLVYRTVRGVTRVAGGSVDALLALLTPALTGTEPAAGDSAAPPAPGREREAVLAALNGVLGDHLVATSNPLAIPMAMRFEGRALDLETAALEARLPAAGGNLLVTVHGLCMNDLQWSRDAGGGHGAVLARELGTVPIDLHYNTGLHVSINGRALAQQLEALLDAWPQPVQRLTLLCHSMGGLVARSALLQATHAGQRWPRHLSDLVFLGTPHHGAPLERAGNGLGMLLGALPYAAPLARLARLRSAGITDLRHGSLQDEDGLDRDRFARSLDRRTPVPLPDGVRCFAVAACLGSSRAEIKGRLLGDGLVPLDSALGHHADRSRALAFLPERQWVGYGIGHVELLHRREVAGQLLAWLR